MFLFTSLTFFVENEAYWLRIYGMATFIMHIFWVILKKRTPVSKQPMSTIKHKMTNISKKIFIMRHIDHKQHMKPDLVVNWSSKHDSRPVWSLIIWTTGYTELTTIRSPLEWLVLLSGTVRVVPAVAQRQPRQRRPYKWSFAILSRSQFYIKQGKLAFSTSAFCFGHVVLAVTGRMT